MATGAAGNTATPEGSWDMRAVRRSAKALTLVGVAAGAPSVKSPMVVRQDGQQIRPDLSVVTIPPSRYRSPGHAQRLAKPPNLQSELPYPCARLNAHPVFSRLERTEGAVRIQNRPSIAVVIACHRGSPRVANLDAEVTYLACSDGKKSKTLASASFELVLERGPAVGYPGHGLTELSH